MPPDDASLSWVCAGTKRITINEGEIFPLTRDGMVSVYLFRPTSNALGVDDTIGSGRRSPAGRLSGGENGGLHVLITDGAHTFYKSIQGKDVRHMPSEEGKELDRVTSILLRPDDETFKVSYKRVRAQLFGGSQGSKNTTSVEVSIRKMCLNNVVRPVWEGSLNDIGLCCYNDLPLFARCAFPEYDRTDASSALSLPIMLGDTINRLQKEIDALRAENRQLEENTLRWKSTSEKLSNRWETEKSELTDRFLTLFNDHKARHAEALKELEQLRGKKQRTGSSVIDLSGMRRSREAMHPDHEDENDYVTYDNAEVNALAAGPSLKQRSANDGKPVASSQGKGFVNPHTGAREFSHPKELFSSDDDDEMVT
jgi:hypothetical protein